LLNYDRMLLDESYEIESSSLKGIAKVCKGGTQKTFGLRAAAALSG